MIANPKVTVAIPVYNGANYLATAIDSALTQDYENTEVIVVNDGSTDNGATDAVARSYGSRIKYIVQPNKGVAGAMNTALAHMSGDIFTWLSHDDIHLPEKVSHQVSYWHRLGRKDAILFSDYYLIDASGRVIAQSNLPFEKYLKKPMLPLLQGAINGCTLFIPAHLLREFGPFDETLRYVQDYELWNKILERHEFFLQPRHLIKYRVHPGQDTNRPESVTEGDALWIRMLNARSSADRVQLFGSELRFFTEMATFLENTTYQEAPAYARRRTGGVVAATLVSIVLFASDNHTHDEINRAVHSVLAQTHRKFELLLVDGAAGANAAHLRGLASGDPRVHVIVSSEAGVWSALNCGMSAARGDYVALLVPGDAFAPDKIATQLRCMQERGEMFSYTATAVANEAADLADRSAAEVATGDLYPAIFALPPFALSTVMLHRVLISAGFAFGNGPAADLVGFAWVARRHSVLGLPNRLTVTPEQDTPRQRLERREALLAALAADPIHAAARDGLIRLRHAIATDRAAVPQGQEAAAGVFGSKLETLLAQGRRSEALSAAREAVQAPGPFDTVVEAACFLGQALGKPREGLEALLRVASRYGVEGLHQVLGHAFATCGDIDAAIPMFREHLRRLPEDGRCAYQLASCLALRAQFDEADALFARDIVVPLGNGRITRTAIINFAPPRAAGDLAVPPGRQVFFDPSAEQMRDVAAVYFVCCDTGYAKLFARGLLRSIERHAAVPIGLHLHLVNPDMDCLDLIEDLAATAAIPVAISYEVFNWPEASADTLRTYYSISRFLVLPRLHGFYGKPIVVADIDQLVVNSLAPLVEAAKEHDIGLIAFEHQAANLLSYFSASMVLVGTSTEAAKLTQRICDYLATHLADRHAELWWHLDQIALAVSVLPQPGLRRFAIPPQLMHSEVGTDTPDHGLPPETVFWPVAYSTPANADKLESGYSQTLSAGRPTVKLSGTRRRHIADSPTLVSVIVPFFDEIDVTMRATRSVLRQTHQNLELVLVDDGCREDVAPVQELAARDGRVRLLRQVNAGAGAARNRGIAAATGDYIAFLDADDFFLARKLERQLNLMQSRGAKFSHTSYHVFYKDKFPSFGIIHSGKFSGHVYPKIITGCPIAMPTVMMHRSLVESGFAFPVESHIGEDLFAWSWVAQNCEIHGIDEPLSIVEWSDTSAALRIDKQILGLRFVLGQVASYSSRTPPFAEIRKLEAMLRQLEKRSTESDALFLQEVVDIAFGSRASIA